MSVLSSMLVQLRYGKNNQRTSSADSTEHIVRTCCLKDRVIANSPLSTKPTSRLPTKALPLQNPPPPSPPPPRNLRRCHRVQPTGIAAEISTSAAQVRATLLVLQRRNNCTTTTTGRTGTTSKGGSTPPTAGFSPRDSRALTCRACQGQLETRTDANGASSVRCANCSSDWVPAGFGGTVANVSAVSFVSF